ncbi:TIGR03089 family protein [Actinoplanes sp. NPDC049596]|uniref:TIGR03089 family protein n=1 Tax=unclassified Actinoplanes TaxID=2626549 RepID=UPI00342E5D5D
MTGHDHLITYYDDATGERTALTASELGTWAAATAALLTTECGHGPRSTAAVLLPPHWQTAAVLLGAWSAGIAVSYRDWATAGLSPAGAPLDVTFVHRRRVDSWLDDVPIGTDQFVLSLLPGRSPEPPRGYRDYPTAVHPHLGAAPPSITPAPEAPATVDGTTYGAYAAIAAELAAQRGIGPGDRVLIDATTQEQPLTWLLTPMVAGASIILCANLNPANLNARVEAERVTHSFL